MGQYTEEPLHNDPNLPAGWHRKVVQRQTGATAGQWDVYVFNPEGKKFRSRNELRNYFEETNSSYNYEDFDFSVKGKGHTTKGKTPTKSPKKTNSKETSTPTNNRSSSRPRTKKVAPPPPPPPASNNKRKSSTPKATPPTPSSRPKRQPPPPKPASSSEDDDDEELTEEEISNVKLKVKVGYTATGAMIRPPANGSAGRKKKPRFRNMKIKKTVTSTPAAAISLSPVEADALTIKNQEEEKKKKKDEVTPKKRTAGRQSTGGRRKKRKSVTAPEPVAGPSGLQKPPRRVLNRSSSSNSAPQLAHSEDDEEEDDYFDVLYPTNNAADVSTGSDPLKIEGEDMERQTNGVRPSRSRQRPALMNGGGPPVVVETVPSIDEKEVGPMTAAVEEQQRSTPEEVGGGHQLDDMVVIGDSVDVHNYAKPHAV